MRRCQDRTQHSWSRKRKRSERANNWGGNEQKDQQRGLKSPFSFQITLAVCKKKMLIPFYTIRSREKLDWSICRNQYKATVSRWLWFKKISSRTTSSGHPIVIKSACATVARSGSIEINVTTQSS